MISLVSHFHRYRVAHLGASKELCYTTSHTYNNNNNNFNNNSVDVNSASGEDEKCCCRR
jgi:hypothetical protein